jgi:hypothetical protein
VRDVEHPQLGRLVWVEDAGVFEGSIAGASATVELSVEVIDDASLAAQLAHAIRVSSAVSQIEKRANQFLVDQMLKLKNESWLDEGELPLRPEEFGARIRLGRIDVQDEGQAVLIFDDGDVFCGHYLTVILEPDGTLRDAGMFG